MVAIHRCGGCCCLLLWPLLLLLLLVMWCFCSFFTSRFLCSFLLRAVSYRRNVEWNGLVCSNSSGLMQRGLAALRLPGFPVMFYCEHRINHCPVVYAHAHKMHHYLHDTTAFDAHVYGSGMNEEYLWIVAETLPCILAMSSSVAGNGGAASTATAAAVLFPFCFNVTTLRFSWLNKGGHSRTSNQVRQVGRCAMCGMYAGAGNGCGCVELRCACRDDRSCGC